MKKKLYLLITMIAMLSLVACSSNNSQDTSNNTSENATQETTEYTGLSVEEIQARGEIVLGTAAEYPPYEWHQIDGTEDKIVGVDIEIAQKIADELGVSLSIKDMAFDGLLGALKVGDIDFVIAGMVANDERKQVVDFSEPYYEQTQDILVRAEDADKYTSVDDLVDKNVGVQLGSVQQQYAEENFTESNLTAIQDNNNMVMELKNQTLDAIFMAGKTAEQFAAINDGLVVVSLGIPNEAGAGVAVAKGNAELLEIINKVVAELKEENVIDGWFDEYSQISADEN